MTPAERAVLARYPDAECWRTPSGVYSVLPRNPFPGVSTVGGVVEVDILGTGPTPAEAWDNAAARLDPPVAPPDGTR